MAKVKQQTVKSTGVIQPRFFSLLVLSWLVLLQGCATSEELFAGYDENFCVVPEHPSSKFVWEPVVYFKTDSAEVSDLAFKRLQNNADTLKNLPGYMISLKAYADHRASAQYNQALSNRRLKAVKSRLARELGIGVDRIVGSAHGESSPLTGETVKPVSVDRRVEMLLLNPQRVPVVNQPLIRAGQQ